MGMKVFLRSMTALLLVLLVGATVFYASPLWVNDQIIRFRLWRAHVQSEYVDVDGYQVHYFEAKPAAGDGEVVVLVHGLGSRGEDWAPLIPKLAAQGFHVYVPDLLGYGRSAKPAEASYSIQLEEKTVADFMTAKHLTHADVAGWSMGGWIVLALGLDHPELADKLVVYDSAGVYFPPTWEPKLFDPMNPKELFELQTILSPHPQPFPAFVAKDVLAGLQGRFWVVNRSLHAMTGGHDLLDFRLHTLKQPTLVMWGSEDRLIPLAAGEQMHREIPKSQLMVVDGCGHLAPGECSGPVAKGTVEFLKQAIRK
jgi:pimeloyl-ACP methyl ester carboxylesterase